MLNMVIDHYFRVTETLLYRHQKGVTETVGCINNVLIYDKYDCVKGNI